MMRRALSVGSGGLRRPRVEPAIALLRIGRDDLRPEFFRQLHRERRLSRRSRPADDDDAQHPAKLLQTAASHRGGADVAETAFVFTERAFSAYPAPPRCALAIWRLQLLYSSAGHHAQAVAALLQAAQADQVAATALFD